MVGCNLMVAPVGPGRYKVVPHLRVNKGDGRGSGQPHQELIAGGPASCWRSQANKILALRFHGQHSASAPRPIRYWCYDRRFVFD
jgi:hypothetical protein